MSPTSPFLPINYVTDPLHPRASVTLVIYEREASPCISFIVGSFIESGWLQYWAEEESAYTHVCGQWHVFPL